MGSLKTALLLCTVFAAGEGCRHQQNADNRPSLSPKLLMQLQRRRQAANQQTASTAGVAEHLLNRHPERPAGTQKAFADDPSKQCSAFREQLSCIGSCIWCRSKDSPMPGSHGFCVAPYQAQSLPSWTYDCKFIDPTNKQHGSQPAGQQANMQDTAATVPLQTAVLDGANHALGASAPTFSQDSLVYPSNGQPGGGDQCGKIRKKKKCTPKGCLWCANKYSPWAGSDGVCVSEDQAKYLPDTTYKCKKISATEQTSKHLASVA